MSQDCIESLRQELIDLQSSILDVFSKTGQVCFASWKFPDRISSSLDMVALLEQCDFVDGEDAFNQHTHVFLLELVIDRLLLLLQSFNVYVEQLSFSHKREPTPPKGSHAIGLIVIKYWMNLVQFGNMKWIRKDKQDKTKVLACNKTVASASTPTLGSFSPANAINHTAACVPHSATSRPDSLNASCQTVESSLLPCGACHQVQSILRKTGDALVELFRGEGLPSSLKPLSAAVDDTLEVGQMSAGDVSQWGSEQLRDMRRLAKHLQDVRDTVQPLKERLAAAEAEQKKFDSQLESTKQKLQQEADLHKSRVLHLELLLQKAKKSTEKAEQRLREEQQRHKTEMLSLEERNSRLKGEVAAQQESVHTLESEKNALQERVRSEEEACLKLQEKIQKLEGQISETQQLIDKENAKYLSACRQQESMQAKQASLLRQVNVLDEECEELRAQLQQQEERESDVEDQLQRLSGEKTQVQAQLVLKQGLCVKLQREKQTLETNAGELKRSVCELAECVQSLRKREKLLVAFPELSPLAQAQPQSTGNVLLDMEQQFQANCIRIRVLEQENATLHSSTVKLRERAQRTAGQDVSIQDTWSVSLPSTSGEKHQNHLEQAKKSPMQSSSAALPECSDNGREDGGRGSRPHSTGVADRVSPAATAPSHLKVNLQSPLLDTGSAVKTPPKAYRTPYVSRASILKQRKK